MKNDDDRGQDPAIPEPGHAAQAELSPLAPGDGRQSPAAAAICRGTRRLLADHGLTTLTELPLPNGRRADIMALDGKGTIWIVEIKSGIDDFRTDRKWPEYRDYCDHLLFAVAPDFPVEVLPEDTGLIIADRFGGELVRRAPLHALAASRRRSLLLRLGRMAMARLHAVDDPELRLEALIRE